MQTSLGPNFVPKAYGDATLVSSLREELQELASDHLGAAWKETPIFSVQTLVGQFASTPWCSY